MSILQYKTTTGEVVADYPYAHSDNDIVIHYATDLHLNHTLGNMTNDISIFERLELLASNLSVYGILLLGGDISDNPTLTKRFLNKLKNPRTYIIYVLGNHEYWQFGSTQEAEDYYQKFSSRHLIFLNDSMVYFTTKYVEESHASCSLPLRYTLEPHMLSNEQLLAMSVQQIRDMVSTSRLVVLGGAGFAGYNKVSPSCCIFNDTADDQQELERSQKFEHLYRKLLPILQNTNSIVLTHTPKSCWCADAEYDTDTIYISGHTHQNYYYDDGSIKVYNDAQTAYHRKDLLCRWFHLNATYDAFKQYGDGIYLIEDHAYIDFYEGRTSMDPMHGKTLSFIY